MNGDEVQVRQGDKVITLEERLTDMSAHIRRLEIALVILIALTVLNLVVGPDRFWNIISGLLGS